MVTPDKLGDWFYRQIRTTVERHGDKGKRLWAIAGGAIPLVTPRAALDNLHNILLVISVDFEDEAKALIRDLEELFRQ